MLASIVPLLFSATSTSAFQNTPRQMSNATQPPCKLPVWTMSNFLWFNSTNNLDCDRQNRERPREKGDRRDAASQLLCMTGLSSQPSGYGPPDTLTVDITGLGHCRQRNPGSVPPKAIGKGWVKCGGSAPNLFFEGDSNSAEGIASLRLKDEFYCVGGKEEGPRRLKVFTANGKVDFAISCTHDAGRNATCVSKEKNVRIPITDWATGSGR